MKAILSLLLVSLVVLGAVSCTSPEFKKTKSGLLYKIISDGKGPLPKKGEFLKLDVIEKIRDSVIFNSHGSIPFYFPVDSPRPVYSHTEVLPLLRKGDSAVVVLLIDSLQRRNPQPLPPFIKKKDKLTLTFRVLDIFASEGLVNSDRDQELEKEKQRESKSIEDYLAKKNIHAEKTAKGTYVVVQNPGEGPQVDSGKQVAVRYTGHFFPSGVEFQSNMNPPGNEPIKFVVGQGGIIEGWDDGLRKFKKGGKGVLYIPSFLGYWTNAQRSPGQKPFENLYFDVEVVDVTDAPKPAAGPQMPQMPQQAPVGGQNHK